MNPEAQYRRYQPDYTGMEVQELPFCTLPDPGGNLRQYKLDVITAPGPAARPRPVVFFIHGGGFLEPNDKRQAYISLLARDLTAAGYAVIAPDYPQFPDEAQLAAAGGEPAASEAAAAAVHEAYLFVQQHAGSLHLDAGTTALIGGSAGAMTGFYAIARYPQDSYRVFLNLWGAPAPLPGLSGFPPVFSVHGDADPLVPYERELPVQQELERHHIDHVLITLPGSGHTPLSRMAEFWPDALAFLRRHTFDF